MSITATDKDRGYKLDHVLIWSDIITPFRTTSQKFINLLNVMHSLIPNESDVQIVGGKVNIDHWDDNRRFEEIFYWAEHCFESGIINEEERRYIEIELRWIIGLR